MNKIKHSDVAGSFYNDDKNELLTQLKFFENNNIRDYDILTRAVIVPHAGYMFSGQIASEGFQYLDKNAKNVFIIAPVHRTPVNGIALLNSDEWETPLGNISINQEINKELNEKFNCEYFDLAFDEEHSIEVQLPFIQYYMNDVKIIPVLVGSLNNKKLDDIIDFYWQDTQNVFVISTDLSHFYPSDEAKKIDSLTAEMIETQNIENFHPAQACGSSGLCSMVEFSDKNTFSLIRIDMKNSGEITGEKERVVGYGSWLLYEGKKSEFIKKYFSDYVLDICSKSIVKGLNNKKLDINETFKNAPAVLKELGASFVTLQLNNQLRGCIGSIVAHQPLIEDLSSNAYNAAFNDTRFLPLTEEEYENLDISVSLLSSPEKIYFKNEEDLLAQIKPFEDGIIIKDGIYQAVYLPSVWEQLPDKIQFLQSLKMKAGLSPDYFSERFEAYKFSTESIK